MDYLPAVHAKVKVGLKSPNKNTSRTIEQMDNINDMDDAATVWNTDLNVITIIRFQISLFLLVCLSVLDFEL